MSARSNGSVASSRAEPARLRARTACPAAQAVRAAPYSRVARSGLVHGQRGGPFVGVGGGDVPATLSARTATSCEGVGDVGVGPVDGRGAVPGGPVRVVRADGVGQGPVHLPLFEAGGRLVDRGPDQRVPHRDGCHR